jgi:hypothetical protein
MTAREPRAPAELQRLSGDEQLSIGSTVLDFWRWALGDLRMNTARGFLAEYLVAAAVGSKAPNRVEWASHDVETRNGDRLEVKASGYLQSWAQARLSVPSYSFKSVRTHEVWDPALAEMREVDPEERVDAWVFALQKCSQPDDYDPLDVGQWEFRAISHRRLFRSGQTSARLSFFARHDIEPVGIEGLADAVKHACADNRSLGRS